MGDQRSREEIEADNRRMHEELKRRDTEDKKAFEDLFGKQTGN